MTPIALQRLAWQLPMLLLLAAVLTPDLPWLSPSVGFWPLWLTAMPASAWLLARFRKLGGMRVTSPGVSSQVLVFPAARQLMSRQAQASRHAA